MMEFWNQLSHDQKVLFGILGIIFLLSVLDLLDSLSDRLRNGKK
jgi:hypothetical protein